MELVRIGHRLRRPRRRSGRPRGCRPPRLGSPARRRERGSRRDREAQPRDADAGPRGRARPRCPASAERSTRRDPGRRPGPSGSRPPGAPGRSPRRAVCVFRPSSRPSASTMGLPDEPEASGAVCSMLPPMSRPPGPRKDRSTPETSPIVVRTPPPAALATAKTAEPNGWQRPARPGQRLRAGGLDLQHRQIAVHVLAERRPRSRRPSPKTHVAPSPWTLWALVSTRFSATTTPDPRRQCPPMPTTAGAARSVTLCNGLLDSRPVCPFPCIS